MTTPHKQLREAADIFACMQDDKTYLGDYLSSGQLAAIEFASEFFRALADAQSDAEKTWIAWATTQGFDMSTSPLGDWLDDETSESQISYLAGHAQGVAAGIAAQEAKCAELERELRMYRDCADEEDEQQTELVDFFRKEFVREGQRGDDDGLTTEQCAIRVMREQSTALATAKADALELANEVRRMWKREEYEIRSAYDPHQWHARDGELKQLQSDRPAAVITAMERYK